MRLPWFLKIGVKIVLAVFRFPHRLRTPAGHVSPRRASRAVRICQPGFQASPGVRRAAGRAGECPQGDQNEPGAIPVSQHLLSPAHGFECSILVDIGNFSLPSIEIYRDFARWLSTARDLRIWPILRSVGQMLARLKAEYHTGGMRSLQAFQMRASISSSRRRSRACAQARVRPDPAGKLAAS